MEIGRLARAAGALAVALGTGLVPAAHAAEPLEYVALGDSAAAGPLIPPPAGHPLCLRSGTSYPQVAAELLGAELTDVTCSGAEIEDFSEPQYGLVRPQYEALRPSTDLVTVTIGGNDVDLVQTAVGCLNLLPEPFGRSCADELTEDGDVLADRINALADEFDEVLAEISWRAPRAEIYVVGYATYIRDGGCYPHQPMWARDATYIQASVDRLSAVLRERAVEHGAEFVDLAPVSEGHDVCAPIGERYIEGVLPTSLAAPLHPNDKGMTAFGHAVAEAIRSASSNTAAD